MPSQLQVLSWDVITGDDGLRSSGGEWNENDSKRRDQKTGPKDDGPMKETWRRSCGKEKRSSLQPKYLPGCQVLGLWSALGLPRGLEASMSAPTLFYICSILLF